MKGAPQFPPSFLFLQQEGHLISACLSLGLTELRAAHVQNKGAFYSCLFNLSIGLERLLKAIVIIDHMTTNSLVPPTKSQLKGYGHNIKDIYDTIVGIGKRLRSTITERSQLDGTNQEILDLLSDFALTTRYHNLDALTASQGGTDPLTHWNRIVVAILRSDVPSAKKDRISAQGRMVGQAISDFTVTIMRGLDREPLSTEDALSLSGLHQEAARYAVFRIVQLLCPIRDLLGVLSRGAYGLGFSVPPFPQMQEFLEWLCGDRRYVLRKSKWP